MHQRATTTFYILHGFALMTALFVLQPSQRPEVAALQSTIKHQFSVAWQETIGDQPYFTEVAVIFDGVSDFYHQAATISLALVKDESTDRDLAYIFSTAYNDFAQIFTGQKPFTGPGVAETKVWQRTVIASPAVTTFGPIEPPMVRAPQVAGAVLDNTPVNLEKPWVTMRDNLTGQLYCIALYNGEVNKYMGMCANDYR
jgi:hypothetical protein